MVWRPLAGRESALRAVRVLGCVVQGTVSSEGPLLLKELVHYLVGRWLPLGEGLVPTRTHALTMLGGGASIALHTVWGLLEATGCRRPVGRRVADTHGPKGIALTQNHTGHVALPPALGAKLRQSMPYGVG